MPRFEYTTINSQTWNQVDLNAKGEEGWELVSTTMMAAPDDEQDSDGWWLFIFKRELPQS